MKNVLEVRVDLSCGDDGGYRFRLHEDLWYGDGEEAKWRSHGYRFASPVGKSLKMKIDIENLFDHISSMIPEEYRTERLKKWIESKAEEVTENNVPTIEPQTGKWINGDCMKSELKPCPFCGGDATIEFCESNFGLYYSVGCNTEGCRGCHDDVLIYEQDKQKAIAAWNKRNN